MVIKHATRKDIAALTAVETACFPPAEAATEKEFIDRVQYYGNHFWLLYEGDKLLPLCYTTKASAPGRFNT